MFVPIAVTSRLWLLTVQGGSVDRPWSVARAPIPAIDWIRGANANIDNNGFQGESVERGVSGAVLPSQGSAVLNCIVASMRSVGCR